MPASGIVECVDIFEQVDFDLSAGLPDMPPDEFGFQGLEEALYDGIIEAISLARHRDLEAELFEAHLIFA